MTAFLLVCLAVAVAAASLCLAAALVAGTWLLILRAADRHNCAVCRAGGHPGDYPEPKGRFGDTYRMCAKHLAVLKRTEHLERNLRR